MSASLESTATMDQKPDPASVVEPASGPSSLGAVAVPDAGAQRRFVRGNGRTGVSPTVLVTVFGGIVTALLGGQIVVMTTMFGTVNEQIADLRAEVHSEIGGLRAEVHSEIGGLRAEMHSEIGGIREEIGGIREEIGALRSEMQAGFREIHVILLDHTDRLARLEAHVGLLPRG